MEIYIYLFKAYGIFSIVLGFGVGFLGIVLVFFVAPLLGVGCSCSPFVILLLFNLILMLPFSKKKIKKCTYKFENSPSMKS